MTDRERTPAVTPTSFLEPLLLARVLPWLRTIGLTIVLGRIQEAVSQDRAPMFTLWLGSGAKNYVLSAMRFPAAMNGIYGIRSTKNSTNSTASHFGPFDVAGHFARDVDAFNYLGGVMYPDSEITNYTKFPKKILFPQEYWENINPNYTAPCNDYVKRLERFLGVNRTVIDTNSLWQQSSKQKSNLADYFANVSAPDPTILLSEFDIELLFRSNS